MYPFFFFGWYWGTSTRQSHSDPLLQSKLWSRAPYLRKFSYTELGKSLVFTRGCCSKGLFAPKRCWTLDLEGSEPPRPRPFITWAKPLGFSVSIWGLHVFILMILKQAAIICRVICYWFLCVYYIKVLNLSCRFYIIMRLDIWERLMIHDNFLLQTRVSIIWLRSPLRAFS